MDLSLLNISIFELITKAMTDPIPLKPLPQDESEIADCTQVFMCYLPEQLRGLHILRTKHCDLGNTLYEQLQSTLEASSDNTTIVDALDCVELRVKMLMLLIQCELVRLEPSLIEHTADCVCVSDWKIVRLIEPKRKKKGNKSAPQHTLQ